MPSNNKADGRLVVISAPSGAGKTSLTHALAGRLQAEGVPVHFSVSYTTREPRGGERNGIDYHFIDELRFKEMIEADGFLEYARVFDNFYGTGRAETRKLVEQGYQVLMDIDWQGARQVREKFPQAMTIFISPPSMTELEKRLRERGLDDEATIRRRMALAKDEMSHANEYDHRIVNDDFEQAVDDLHALFRKP